ncbi:acyltransferase family protein [Gaoshiqia sp. Z1-71]|uniref:acyltransferase family protein n=1 Tax=Gaoshiqia hydrogeniformans TaxID=3290090 RepID=UPI003BF81198
MTFSKRLMSLDVLRGLTIVLMIIVNNPGSWSHVYAPLRHAAWNGCTPTDLVFPFFLFIVGTAMWYSFKKFDHQLTKELSLKIIRRTVLIFALGLFLNGFPFIDFHFSSFRLMGVLQRIALGYGIASFIVLLSPIRWTYIISALLLTAYWSILWLFGGEQPFSLEGNASLRFDLFVLGEGHLYRGYGIPFDPEGLLSTLPAVVNVLFGYFAGRLIDRETNKQAAVYKLIGFGAAAVILALIWNPFFPINKPIWSGSYVLYTSGLAGIFLALLIWVTDIKGQQKWAQPFLVYGMNPLFIFVLAGMWARMLSLVQVASLSGTKSLKAFIYQDLLVPWAGELNGSLLFALHLAVLFWIVGFILYRKKIFIKI